MPSRSRNEMVGSTPASSCECERHRPSKNCVVGGLPKSWATAAEHHRNLLFVRQIVDEFSGLVGDHHCVNVDVAFRMPFRLLRNTDQRSAAREKSDRRRRVRKATAARSTVVSASEAVSQSRPRRVLCGRSVTSIVLQISTVSGAISNSNRAANCAARKTRSESSANVSDDT